MRELKKENEKPHSAVNILRRVNQNELHKTDLRHYKEGQSLFAASA
jgi:hypothetical protein